MSSLNLVVSPTKGAARITDANQTGLDLSGNFTAEFWIRADAAGGGDDGDIITKLRGSSGDEPYAIYKDGTSVVVRIYDGTNVTQVSWASILTNNGTTWEHIAITCTIANADATKFILYKDGVSQGNGTVDTGGSATSLLNTNGAFVIGNAGVRADGLKADLFDVRIWTVVRSGANIAANDGLVFLDPDLEASLVGDWFVGGSHFRDRAQLATGRNDLVADDVRYATFTSSQPSVTGPRPAVAGKLVEGGPATDEEPPNDVVFRGLVGKLVEGGSATDEEPPNDVVFRGRVGAVETLDDPGAVVPGSLQYVMRGYDTALAKLVTWPAPDIDTDASEYVSPGDINTSTIVVFRTKGT